MVHVFAAAHWSFLISPVPAMVVARSLRKRVVLNYHSGEADEHLSRFHHTVRRLMRLADRIVVPSEFLREVFSHHGYQVEVIPNVVDLASFRFRERSPLRPRLLSTRNLEPIYGVDMTLRAFAVLRNMVPDATLTIAGTGSRAEALHRLAGELGTDGIRFAGRVEPRDMTSLYDDHDIFLNSSLTDNQPLSILEAFAAGTPVVSTASGGIPTMIRHRETGLLVERREPEAMAAAVRKLLREPGLARDIAHRALSSAQEHAWPLVRDRWVAAYSGAAS